MKYDIARDLIKSGDVLAWTHRGWGSWYDLKLQLVRMWTRSEFCHVGVAWVVGDRVFVLEAVSSGVRIMPLSNLLPCFWIKRGEWNGVFLQRALKEIGKPYSTWQAILGGFGLLKGADDDKWQCAEYVSYILGLPWATPAEVVYGLQALEECDTAWLNE